MSGCTDSRWNNGTFTKNLPLRRPSADGVGEDRRQRHRRRDPALVCPGHQPLLGLRCQPVVVADRAVWCRCGPRPGGRQFGCARHLGQPLLPPVSVSLTRGVVFLALGAITPVAVAGRRQRRAPVQLGQIAKPARDSSSRRPPACRCPDAVGCGSRRTGQRDVDDLTVFNSQTLVGFTVAQLRQCGFDHLGTLSAEIDHAEHRPTRRWPWSAESRPGRNRVRSIGAPPRDQIPRAPGARDLLPAVEFDVKMGGDPAKLLLIGAADPVRVLHGGQWERGVLRATGSDGPLPRPAPPHFPLSVLSRPCHESTVGLAASSAKVMSAPRLRQPPASAIMRIEFRPNWIRSSWSATSAAGQPSWAATVALISSLLIRSAVVHPARLHFAPAVLCPGKRGDAALPEMRQTVDIGGREQGVAPAPVG